MKNLTHKIKLLRGLLTSATAFAGPDYVNIDITRRCNLKCLGCCFHSEHVPQAKQRYFGPLDISLDLIKKNLPALKKSGTHLIIIQGAGEPLLHPDILEIVSLIKQAGLELILITNGTLLDQDKLNTLIDARLDVLKVTLWASSLEQYKENYPGTDPLNFDLVLNNLRLAVELKNKKQSLLPEICLHHPINRNNFRTLDKFVDLAVSLKCNAISFSPFSPVWQELNQFALSQKEEEEVSGVLRRVSRRLKALAIRNNIQQVLLRYQWGEKVWKKVPCYISWFEARIRPDGMVLPCGRSDLIFGNLNQESFPEIWNSPAIRNFRRQSITCKGLSALTSRCDCDYCCFVYDNLRVHRIFKWFAPLRKK
jgi:MoaA/NifB/PqqE/SkfB family radical SAM enzyme